MFLEKTNKIDEFLVFSRKKKTKITNIKNDRGNITAESVHTERIVTECY